MVNEVKGGLGGADFIFWYNCFSKMENYMLMLLLLHMNFSKCLWGGLPYRRFLFRAQNF